MTESEIEKSISSIGCTTPGPRLMRIHIVQNSTSMKFQKSPNIHLVHPIIHLVPKFGIR